jgi:sugar/nucleoside kinase (ribokinase family)
VQRGGGGNCLNALCVLSLGFSIKSRLFTKIGDDENGRLVIEVCREAQIDTSSVVIKKGMSSAVSYVIVDSEKNTRTSIHVPAEELTVSEIPDNILQNVDLIYCDGRHTEVACRVLEYLNQSNNKQIPCVLDAEKWRGEHFDKILRTATYIITNSQFPVQFLSQKSHFSATTPSSTTILKSPTDLLVGIMSILMNSVAKFVITTLGSYGSVLLTRQESISTLGLSISFPTKCVRSFYELETEIIRSKQSLITKSHYSPQNAVTLFQYLPSEHDQHSVCCLGVHCSAYPLSSSEVVNTTGAGDAFVATVCYCLLHNYPIDKMLSLASFVAATKCCESGGSLKGIIELNKIPSHLIL